MRLGAVFMFFMGTALASYLFGAGAGMYWKQGYVSLEDLKLALVKVIRKLERLEARVEALEGKVKNGHVIGIVKKNGTRIRLGVWGTPIGTLRKGTKVVVFGKEGEFYITNFGYVHASLVEVRNGE